MTEGGAGPAVHEMTGVIASCGFESGDRVVVGHWASSPIGPFTDVMWSEPDGTRVLYVPDDRAGRFVTSLYRFERVEVVPIATEGDGRRRLVVRIDGVSPARTIELRARRGLPIPFRRPAWMTRWIEAPIAKRLMGVRTYGVTRSGVQEWYQASWWRPVRFGMARVGDRGLGPSGPVRPAVRFGFSEPPTRPSMVSLRTLLHDPSGRLDEVVA